MRVLGIDIGGTSVKAAVMVGDRVEGQASSGRYSRPDLAALVGAIREAVHGCGANGTGRTGGAGFEAVGLCVPGRRDETGLCVVASVNVPAVVGQRLDALVAAALGDRAEVDSSGNRDALVVTSDAHAAAVDLAARLAPAPDGPWRLLAISLGTGVGACVLDGMSGLRVSGESPGHFGQIDVSVALADGTVPVGPDGGRGGLEAYVGLPALLKRLGGPAETLMERVDVGDVALVALARAIRIGHAVYRPHTVGLMGGVGVGLARHAGVLRAMVDDGLTNVARAGWEMVLGVDQFHAARGAARLAAAAPGAGRAP